MSAKTPSVIEEFRLSLKKKSPNLSGADIDWLLEDVNRLVVDLSDLRRDLLAMRERRASVRPLSDRIDAVWGETRDLAARLRGGQT